MSPLPQKSATSAPSPRNGASGTPIFRPAEPWRARRTVPGTHAAAIPTKSETGAGRPGAVPGPHAPRHADEERDGDGAAEHRPEEKGELHVAHSHPGRIREGGGEE